MNIFINEEKYEIENNFSTVSDIFDFLNIPFPHYCGKKGKCGKCKIKIENPLPPKKEELNFLNEDEQKEGIRLACLTSPFENMKISFDNIFSEEFHINENVSKEKAYLAIDIGTTNIEAELFNEKGEKIAYISQLNSQVSKGSDVISKIEYDIKNPNVLTNLIINQLDLIIKKFNDIASINEIIITGNTVMLYLLTGKNTLPLSNAPYKNIEMFGKNIKLPFKHFKKDVYISKCMDAFVGADITCGIISAENTDPPSLFVDFGTNGEIILYKNGKYYNSSTAVGPCFEGASLCCGSTAKDGVISKVWFDGRNIKYSKIGEQNNSEKQNTICASGVIDFLAILLRIGNILKNGNINKNSSFANDDKIYLPNEKTYLSQDDIRNIQLAKSAVYTGIICLLKESNTNISEIKNLYLFGNFSKYLNINNAFYIGLLPRFEQNTKIHLLGNGALKGAKKILLQSLSNTISRETEIAKNSINIELNSLDYFQNEFIKNIDF